MHLETAIISECSQLVRGVESATSLIILWSERSILETQAELIGGIEFHKKFLALQLTQCQLVSYKRLLLILIDLRYFMIKFL